MEDGTLWNCGFNYYGNLGVGNVTQQNVFGQRAISSPVVDLVAQDYSTLVIHSGFQHNYILTTNTFTQIGNGEDVKRFLFAGLMPHHYRATVGGTETVSFNLGTGKRR